MGYILLKLQSSVAARRYCQCLEYLGYMTFRFTRNMHFSLTMWLKGPFCTKITLSAQKNSTVQAAAPSSHSVLAGENLFNQKVEWKWKHLVGVVDFAKI